ncbi:MAG TPA: alpha/beta hydrolase-fold protein [Gaiellaceae bacterium]|jgi:enterochelin esterase-like enzyme|nr:alpha/beta hydrolase-fold protein [Gaiellaceae bacterium]
MSLLAAVVAAAVLPGFTPVAAGPNGGQVLRGPIPGTERPGYVYLPPGFDLGAHYRVVYLLHGMPGSPSEFVAGANLLGWADPAIASGAVPAFVGVMPAAGPRPQYNGEWAGPWERALVDRVVPWVDATLPVDASPRGRVLAGLSAGGFGAADIALRNPGVFGTVESWSGYFTPLHDGPFRHAPQRVLAANDPVLLARADAPLLRAHGVRFFVSTGPFHSHWFTPAQTVSFAHELHGLGIPARLLEVAQAKGEYRVQLAAGLTWALAN